MRKQIISSLAMCVALCGAQQAMAQKLKAADEQLILLKIVELFDEYESYAAIDESFSNNASFFRSLFTSANASVYNDIVGISKGESLSVNEYAKLLANNSLTTRIVISNISHGEFKKQGGVWKVECTFDKSVNLTDLCGVEFASDYLFDSKPYKLKATICYDGDEDICRFEKIEAVETYPNPIPENLRVLKYNNEKDYTVTFRGKSLRDRGFNAMNQAFVSADDPIGYPDPETSVKLIPCDEADACNFWQLKYVPHHWRAKFHYDIPCTNIYNIHSALGNLYQKSTATELGLDIGYLMASKGKMRYAINFGVGYSTTTMDLNTVEPSKSGSGEADALQPQTGYNFHYHCDGTNEANGVDYERYYEGVCASEQVKVGSVFVPIYLDFECIINKYVSAYLSVGVKNYLNLSSSLTNETHINNIYGVFAPPYDGIIDGRYPYDGFGTPKPENIRLVSDAVNPKKYSLDAIAGLGVRIHPYYRLPLYIEAGAYYQMGVLPAFDMNGRGSNSDPLCKLTLEKDDSKTGHAYLESIHPIEYVQSLSSSLDTWRRQNLKVNIGLIYKF